MNDQTQRLLHLSLINGVGPATISSILNHKPDSCDWSEIYRWSVFDWKHICNLSEVIAQKIVNGLRAYDLLAKEIDRIEKSNTHIVTLADDIYPALLREIHAPPAVLYVQGALHREEQSIAIVGSRNASSYGHDVVQMIVPSLVYAGWTIVSGGAMGIDTMAHRTTVERGGRTIVVLGSGLNAIYPAHNRQLFSRIVDSGGAVISSFAMNESPHPGNFPARNRIIAGLSRGCLVVQAAQKSGARITAEYALQQGREVFAVPGPITDSLSVGCHELIQQGAKLVCNANSILEEFGEQQVQEHTIAPNLVVVKQNIASASLFDYEKSSLKERIIHLSDKVCTFEELLDYTQEQSGILQRALIDLQLDGIVEQDFMGRWNRVSK